MCLQFDPAAYTASNEVLALHHLCVQALIHFSLGLFLLSDELIEQGTSV